MKIDPFAPPYDPEIYICDITKEHALLFNKFSLFDYHVLIVSKDFIFQNVSLSNKDFYSALIIMKSLDAFCFFNSGQKAGASQQHFHIQAIPYSSMFEGIKFSNSFFSQAAILKNSKENHFFQIKAFKFVHLLYFFNENILEEMDDENVQNKSQRLEYYYLELMKKLREKRDFQDYNLILTSEWMLIVPRSKEKALDLFSINALGFLGSIVLKDEALLKELNKHKPLNALQSVSFSEEL